MTRPEERVVATGLSPDQAEVVLVTLVPFATPAWTRLEGHLPDSLSRTGLADELPDGASALLEDLRLWDYADALASELRAYLPHRVSRLAASPDRCLTPRAPHGATWRTESCVVDLWDVGVGLVTSVHRLEGSAASWDALREAAVSQEAKRSFLEQADVLIAEVVGAVCAPDPDDARPAHALWVQGMFSVSPHTAVDDAELDAVATVLTDGGEGIESGYDVQDVAVRLGIEVCVVSQGPGRRAAGAVGRVVACQTAVWARAITLDLELARALERATRDEIGLPIDVLESRALDLLSVFEQVEQFGATVGTVAVHLAVRDKAYWECFRVAWGLDSQLQALSSNLDAVGHVYVHLTNALTSRQSRSLNDVLLAITMLNLAMFWITVWEFTQKSLDPFETVSALVVAAAFVSSVVLFFGARRLTRVTSATIARVGARSRTAAAPGRPPVRIPPQPTAHPRRPAQLQASRKSST